MFEEFDLIHRYSRREALRDGVLIDVSETAREAGLRWPVALTAAAWAKCVAVPPGVACQDEAGRLWDVLWLLRCAAGGGAGAEVRFGVHVRNDNRERTPPLVRLKALCGPGDQGEPVHYRDAAGRGLIPEAPAEGRNRQERPFSGILANARQPAALLALEPLLHLGQLLRPALAQAHPAEGVVQQVERLHQMA